MRKAYKDVFEAAEDGYFGTIKKDRSGNLLIPMKEDKTKEDKEEKNFLFPIVGTKSYNVYGSVEIEAVNFIEARKKLESMNLKNLAEKNSLYEIEECDSEIDYLEYAKEEEHFFEDPKTGDWIDFDPREEEKRLKNKEREKIIDKRQKNICEDLDLTGEINKYKDTLF